MRHSLYLRRYRRISGLTQHQVTMRMGIKEASLVSRWENGFSLPDLENAFKLAAVYDVMVDTLFANLYDSMQDTALEDKRIQ